MRVAVVLALIAGVHSEQPLQSKWCPADASFYSKNVQKLLPREFMKGYRVVEHLKDSRENLKTSFLEAGREGRYDQEITSDLYLDKPWDTHFNRAMHYLNKALEKKQEKDLQKFKAAAEALHLPNPEVSFAEIQEKKKMLEPRFESWYVNMDKSYDRKHCMERQLKDIQQTPNRFPAVSFPTECVEGAAPEHCLKKKGYGDCLENGIDYNSISTHGSKGTSRRKMGFHVVANWCSHKRLFEKLESKMGDADYFLVLEDDVILDRNYTMEVLNDFVQNYKEQDWDLLQIDPIGAKSKDDFKGTFKGKPVWAPSNGDDCKQYYGFQAVLVRSSALPNINKWMSSKPAMPIDWIPTTMPNVRSFGGLIARNPEEATHFGRFIAMPSYCAKTVSKSTIAVAGEKATSFEPANVGQREAKLTQTEMDKKLNDIAAKRKAESLIEVQSGIVQQKVELETAKAKLENLKEADAKMATYMSALLEFQDDKAYEQEIKDVEEYVKQSGEAVKAAEEAVSLLEDTSATGTEENTASTNSDQLVIDAPEESEVERKEEEALMKMEQEEEKYEQDDE